MVSLSLRTVSFSLLLVLLSTIANVANAQPIPPGRIVAQSGNAYVSYDANEQTWEIGTSGISRRLDYDPGGGLRPVSLKNKLTNREWLAPSGGLSAELRVDVSGEHVLGTDRAFQVKGYSTRQNPDGSLELEILMLRGPLAAHLHYVAFPGTNILEQWAVVENSGPTVLKDLTSLDSIAITLRPSREELTLYWVQGLNPPTTDKGQPRQVPTLRLRSVKLSEKTEQVIGSEGRSSEGSMGWFALAAPSLKEGLFGGIEWSGAWQLRAVRENGQTSLRAGVEGLRYQLSPSEFFQAPRRFIGFYQGDLDDAANASHAFARTYLLRPPPASFPWTQYNTWFAYYTALDEELLRQEVDSAAALGLEVFVVDAGWYEGSPSSGDFSFGLGTWRENRDKFPSGLAAFADYVHSKGMKFGLWVEPERVDLRYAGPGKPVSLDWLAPGTAFDEPPSPDTPQWAQICLGNQGAREWMKDWLTRIITDYEVDWLKWDNNAWMSCDPPETSGNGNFGHVQGLYEVLDYLRSQFPELIVENCAAGGNRMDYALMRRTDIAWLSDETDPSYRVRYHIFGASYPFPPEYLNSWLVESFWEHLADAEKEPTLLRAWMRSRMMGAFGISISTIGWSPALRSAVAAEIDSYKSMRAANARGKSYHLLPQSDLSEPNLEPPTEPDAAQFHDPETDTTVVFLFRGNVRWAERRVRLRDLNPTTNYQVLSADRQISLQRTGVQLMNQALRFTYADEHPSTILFIKPITSTPPGTPTPNSISQ